MKEIEERYDRAQQRKELAKLSKGCPFLSSIRLLSDYCLFNSTTATGLPYLAGSTRRRGTSQSLLKGENNGDGQNAPKSIRFPILGQPKAFEKGTCDPFVLLSKRSIACHVVPVKEGKKE
ncbi:hypothetical protein WN943_026962 [Citrus x changshan-huyou]